MVQEEPINAFIGWPVLLALLAALFLTLLLAGCGYAISAAEEADSEAAVATELDGKCWHLVRLASNNKGLEWLNEEDANGYELVAIAPIGADPTVYYLTRSTHPGDCRTPLRSTETDAAQQRAEQELQREQQARQDVETRLAQEAAARQAAETRVAELEALLREVRPPVEK